MYFVSGRAFKCSFDHSKCQFFKALNAVFSKVGRFTSEEVVLNLIRAKCLPVLLYGVESCPMMVRDKKSMEFTVNSIDFLSRTTVHGYSLTYEII